MSLYVGDNKVSGGVDVVDNLNSNNKEAALSANQGKILNDKIDNGNVYSMNETKTNEVWIDGKPIYRKVQTFNCENNINTTIPLSVTDYDNIWIDEGNSFIYKEDERLGINWWYAANDFCRTWINAGANVIRFRCASTTIGTRPVYVTFKYTKK